MLRRTVCAPWPSVRLQSYRMTPSNVNEHNELTSTKKCMFLKDDNQPTMLRMFACKRSPLDPLYASNFKGEVVDIRRMTCS